MDDKTFRCTIRDRNFTHAWAREHYSSLGELSSAPELVDNDATETRPSQRQRKLSIKATFLQNKGKEKQNVTRSFAPTKLSRLSNHVESSDSGGLSELE